MTDLPNNTQHSMPRGAPSSSTKRSQKHRARSNKEQAEKRKKWRENYQKQRDKNKLLSVMADNMTPSTNGATPLGTPLALQTFPAPKSYEERVRGLGRAPTAEEARIIAGQCREEADRAAVVLMMNNTLRSNNASSNALLHSNQSSLTQGSNVLAQMSASKTGGLAPIGEGAPVPNLSASHFVDTHSEDEDSEDEDSDDKHSEDEQPYTPVTKSNSASLKCKTSDSGAITSSKCSKMTPTNHSTQESTSSKSTPRKAPLKPSSAKLPPLPPSSKNPAKKVASSAKKAASMSHGTPKSTLKEKAAPGSSTKKARTRNLDPKFMDKFDSNSSPASPNHDVPPSALEMSIQAASTEKCAEMKADDSRWRKVLSLEEEIKNDPDFLSANLLNYSQVSTSSNDLISLTWGELFAKLQETIFLVGDAEEQVVVINPYINDEAEALLLPVAGFVFQNSVQVHGQEIAILWKSRRQDSAAADTLFALVQIAIKAQGVKIKSLPAKKHPGKVTLSAALEANLPGPLILHPQQLATLTALSVSKGKPVDKHSVVFDMAEITAEQQQKLTESAGVVVLNECRLVGGGKELVTALLSMPDAAIISEIAFVGNFPIGAEHASRLVESPVPLRIGPGALSELFDEKEVSGKLVEKAASFDLYNWRFDYNDFCDESEKPRFLKFLYFAYRKQLRAKATRAKFRAYQRDLIEELEDKVPEKFNWPCTINGADEMLVNVVRTGAEKLTFEEKLIAPLFKTDGEVAPGQPSLATLFAGNDTSWSCGVCSVGNLPPTAEKCASCGAAKDSTEVYDTSADLKGSANSDTCTYAKFSANISGIGNTEFVLPAPTTNTTFEAQTTGTTGTIPMRSSIGSDGFFFGAPGTEDAPTVSVVKSTKSIESTDTLTGNLTNMNSNAPEALQVPDALAFDKPQQASGAQAVQVPNATDSKPVALDTQAVQVRKPSKSVTRRRPKPMRRSKTAIVARNAESRTASFCRLRGRKTISGQSGNEWS